MIADTEAVWQYRDTLSLVKDNLPEGAKVFYIGTANGIYLMGDMEFCTPSTISSPTFDEKIETDLNGDSFLSSYLRKYCDPDPAAQNDYVVIYRTNSSG